MSLQIVTWMGKEPTQEEWFYTPKIFFASCRRYGFEPIVLGRNPGEWGGLGSKVKLLKRAIDNGTITAETAILSDSFDVVFTDSPEAILAKFRAIQNENPARPGILWNAERNCFPRAHLAPKFPKCDSSFKYLNSGWGIADVESLRQVFAEEDPDNIKDDHIGPDGNPVYDDDQRWWTDRYLDGSVPIELDNDCRLCVALHDVADWEISILDDGRVLVNETGYYPPVLHFNGNGKNQPYKLEIFKRLGFL